MKNILAIETSCDETSLAIVSYEENKNGTLVSGNVIGHETFSQIDIHAQWGGVVPNIAKREHGKRLPLLLGSLMPLMNYTQQDAILNVDIINECLSYIPNAAVGLQKLVADYPKVPNIDAIAVTFGPGLEPALWTGINFAKSLSILWGVPLIPVNHLLGHIASVYVSKQTQTFSVPILKQPLLALIVSGAHTHLYSVVDWNNITTLGKTRDDACGEAFDKAGRMLGFKYPGGLYVSQAAQKHRDNHQDLDDIYLLPRPMIHDKSLDFSFSGLKTAVKKLIKQLTTDQQPLSETATLAISRSFEEAVTDVLVHKTHKAAKQQNASMVVVSGGVSANKYLLSRLKDIFAKDGVVVHNPQPGLTGDNAAMIAIAGAVMWAQDFTPIDHKDIEQIQATGRADLACRHNDGS